MKTNGKKMSKKKKVIVVIAALLVLAAVAPAYVYGRQAFCAGNKEAYSVANTKTLDNSALQNKTIIFLGSSVTYGSASKGESFVDYMEKRDGIIPVKEAVSGTTLVDQEVWGKKSYIERMKTIDPTIQADAFVCQLSTNDATMKKELGTISDSFALKDFDTQTVAGAIEYVICYAKQTWDCPVIFYTGTQYDSEYYGQMVDLLLEIQKKWDIGVLDLWNDEEMNAVSSEDYNLYMVNGIHPSKAGYREWWTPKFEAYLTEYMGI
jgi:lysophospholipase L1-like esterase